MSDNAERLLDQALNIEPEKRAAFIEAETIGDMTLREELMSLVNEAESANEFFDRLDRAVFASPISSDGEANLEARLHDAELTAGEIAGHYEIISLVGRGGMGAVYRAHDARLNRDVALKFLPSYLTSEPDARNRLTMEARAVAALDHPNVCAIHEIGETAEGRLFIAMPFYEGETLKDQLRRGSLTIDTAIANAIQITRGLTSAHNRGIIHRDVKPGNMIVGPDGTIHLLDFGLAMPIDASLASSSMTPGTVAYMSPEHARGDVVDQRSDLWSLGVVLYEMLAGVRPFRGANAHAMLQAIRNDNPEPIRKCRHEIPPTLETLVGRLLQKNPANRYPGGGEVLADLERVSSLLSATSNTSNTTQIRIVFAGAVLLLALMTIPVWRRPRSESPDQDRSMATRNVAAYELYKHGSDPVLLRSDSGVRVAFADLSQAIALDPNYAPAYSGLARLHMRIGFGGGDSTMSRRKRLALAEEAALKAVELDSMSGDAHLALGIVRRSNYDMKSAEAEFLKAAALDPASSVLHEKLASLYVMMSRAGAALKEARRSMELDALSPSARAEIANALMASDRCDEALVELDRLRSLNPPLLRAGAIASQCYARKQMWEEAVVEARHMIPNGGPRGKAILGYMLGRSHHNEEAEKLLNQLINRSERTHGDTFDVAIVYAGLGDMDSAFEWLSRSIDDRSFGFDWLNVIEREFRRDARFANIAGRVGLN